MSYWILYMKYIYLQTNIYNSSKFVDVKQSSIIVLCTATPCDIFLLVPTKVFQLFKCEAKKKKIDLYQLYIIYLPWKGKMIKA